ncbi:MAG: PKD domain-containing protein, partial [Bacteroidia bacterium]|nr:PKD domain-containing protein [Bacteroidia bacterium]
VFTYARQPLEIYTPPVAAFSPLFSESCDSLAVAFSDQSSGNIIAWNWSFGDGSNDPGASPLHLYGFPGTFDVSLQVTDQHGCMDSTLAPNAVTIHASPEPLIQASASSGCLPFSPALQGLPNGGSSPISSWQWSSGSMSHSGDRWSPIFTDPGIHSIMLEVVDAEGCQGQTTVLIEAFSSPVAAFTVSDQESCAPDTLSFTDLSTGSPVSWSWTMGNGNTSQLQHPTLSFMTNGQFDVSLSIEDVHGCSDTLTKPAYIHLTSPIAGFTLSDSLACPGALLTFAGNHQSERPLISQAWDFGDGNGATGDPVSYRYPLSGIYDVSLIITDSEGCSDSLVVPQAILVEESVQASPTELIYASVVSDEKVYLEFEPYDNRRDDFGAYLIYRSADGISYFVVDSLFDKNQTSFLDQQLSTRDTRYWYKVVPRNSCGNEASWEATQPHATVQLVSFPGIDEATLVWNKYLGWDDVERYEVYRVTGYEPTNQVFLGTTSGEDSTFIDVSFQCDENYSYRVVAVGNGSRAGSDSTFTDPLHLGPQDPTDLIRATVVNNLSILVEWSDADIEKAARIVVERDGGSGYQVIADQPYLQGAAKVSDPHAKVMEQSYTYRVMTIDSCGDATPVGRSGKTILLRANREFSGSTLTWSPYMGWEGGIEGYTLDVYDEKLMTWRTVAQLDGSQTSYTDTKTVLDQKSYCYRVTAWELGGNLSTSQSNEACVEPEPYLYTANAFTPNGDGNNDEFSFGMAFIGDVTIEIYNRWGKKVFETSSMDIPWDGRMSNGFAAPEGVYVFKIEASGYNGQAIHRSGTVTLIR